MKIKGIQGKAEYEYICLCGNRIFAEGDNLEIWCPHDGVGGYSPHMMLTRNMIKERTDNEKNNPVW